MKYYFMSEYTGELAKNIFQIIYIIFFNLRHYHFLDYKWRYLK